ncbi:short-chain alcohol dehydrogenase [Knufia peltigerae]|uniref:Short-chain alcohol dehydrogenase n=1 Tax=Knufia peltigerae TaxID=1002370 RepID=A0AA38YAL2_9EURO|nr:short-chain alcohol dehydrogenase [Knufia peltigerae]
MGIFSYVPASFTDRNLTDQSGKVFIVTGATSGVGELLTDILYSKHSKVYVAARSTDKAEQTIRKIKSKHPTSHGDLIFLRLDLDDLSTIKATAEEFLSKETKLNVLWNNAGVMVPPQGSKTKQGYEKQLGTNDLAPFLFTKLLTPVLQETAKVEPVGSVRVVWVASSAAANFAPPGGVVMHNLSYEKDQGAWYKYGVSKAGTIFQAAEYARRFGPSNILSVSLDPGNLKTPLYQTTPKWQMPFINFVLKDPIYGAYTELFAGFSPDVQMKDGGRFIQPFGKVGHTRKDIELSRMPKSEGGNGVAEEFYEWTEKQVEPFL